MNADQPLRASDAEREATAARLRDAAAEGRLTLQELGERSGSAYAATHSRELEALVADLPAAAPAPAVPERRPRRWFFGIMGGDTLRGPIRLAETATIFNLMGGTDLDLSQARVEGGQLTLRIISIMGGSTIYVPRGVHLDRSGLSLMGGDDMDADDAPLPENAPTVRVRVFNLMGGNDFKRGRGG